MIALVLSLALSAEVMCAKDDAVCWARAYDAELDHSALLKSGYAAAKRLATENDKLAEMWKKSFEEVKPRQPTVLESPVFWLAVGVIIGAGVTTGLAIGLDKALNPAR
jgi:hypothetical protein